MRYVYIIERTISWEYEGIQSVSVEVYSSMKKAQARLPLCFKEDYAKCEKYKEDIEVVHRDNAYDIYCWADNYHAKIYKQEIK